MRILIYSLNYSPELTGIGKYNAEMVEWLVKRGYEVRVVTAPPYYPDWKVWDGFSIYRYKRTVSAGANVWRCPLWVPSVQSGSKRVLHLLSFALTSFPVMLSQIFWRPDVIFVVEPPLFCAPTALLCARLSRARSWLHIQDFEVDAAFDLGLVPKKFEGFIGMLEQRLMGMYDRVSSISERMLKRLDAKGVVKKKQFYFPNWVDTEQIFPMEQLSEYRQELGLDDNCLVALYSGNMGEKQGIEVVLEAASLLINDHRFQFVLCGTGAAYARLRQLAINAKNIHWLPLQPFDKLNELLNLADVHLLPQRSDAADLVMPSKLTGMLASGRPVIATVDTDTQIAKVVKDAGVVVPPENSGALVDALKELLANPGLRYKMGMAGREYAAKHLGLDAILSNFEQGLQACIRREGI